jgi:ABC-type nitrate/sulfonate/bicarbonate transport system ATPase subunit
LNPFPGVFITGKAMGHIVIHGLSKEYIERRRSRRQFNGDGDAGKGENLLVLDQIDLEFNNGELVCILGPSGCGKSTLVRILAGFEKSTSGKVMIDGKEIRGPSSEHIFVFQHSGLLPWLTVWDNVSLGVRKMKEKDAMEELVQQNIDIVGLTGFEYHYPHQLSGGMQRRAELARALVVNPDILFMDEPFAGLDFLTRVNLREEIINMHMLIKKTIIFITHDIDEALIMGDRLVVFSDRPAKVKLALPMNCSHPRDFSKDSRLSDLRKDIYSALGVHYAL